MGNVEDDVRGIGGLVDDDAQEGREKRLIVTVTDSWASRASCKLTKRAVSGNSSIQTGAAAMRPFLGGQRDLYPSGFKGSRNQVVSAASGPAPQRCRREPAHPSIPQSR